MAIATPFDVGHATRTESRSRSGCTVKSCGQGVASRWTTSMVTVWTTSGTTCESPRVNKTRSTRGRGADTRACRNVVANKAHGLLISGAAASRCGLADSQQKQMQREDTTLWLARRSGVMHGLTFLMKMAQSVSKRLERWPAKAGSCLPTRFLAYRQRIKFRRSWNAIEMWHI